MIAPPTPQGRACVALRYSAGGERKSGPFHHQLAAGEADSLESAMRAALTMVQQPRSAWTKPPPKWRTSEEVWKARPTSPAG
jgi:hypothetical protein